jgi:hypothetical protein
MKGWTIRDVIKQDFRILMVAYTGINVLVFTINFFQTYGISSFYYCKIHII